MGAALASTDPVMMRSLLRREEVPPAAQETPAEEERKRRPTPQPRPFPLPGALSQPPPPEPSS